MQSVKIAKISSNGLVLMLYIPKTISKALGLSKGKYVKLYIQDGKLIVEPLGEIEN